MLHHNFIGLFYDPKKSGVDFLVRNIDKIIPIEVGVGKKTKSQLTKAINNYNSDYGILISNRTFSIKKENNIIYIPLRTFSYIWNYINENVEMGILIILSSFWILLLLFETIIP